MDKRIENFNEYLVKIENKENQEKLINLFEWILNEFPNLETRIAWNQPMFEDHGTFIIGFSDAKNHFSVAPEGEVLERFSTKIKDSGYSHGKNLFQIKWDQEIDLNLLKEIIKAQIEEKKDYDKYWR